MAKAIRKLVEIDLIDRPDELARLEIDKASIEELADSIRERGLQNPVRLARRGERYVIVFGDRRVSAHKLLRLPKIEATVVDAEDADILIDRAIENIQRVDLTPIEEAMQYNGMIVKAGMTVDQVAKKVGKKAGAIKRRVEMLLWPGEFMDAVHSRKVGMSVAEELLNCQDETHRSYLLEMAVEHGITKEIARMWVNDWRKSVAPRPESGPGGGGVGVPNFERTHYVGCERCDNPTKFEDVKHLGICQACLKRLFEMLSKEDS